MYRAGTWYAMYEERCKCGLAVQPFRVQLPYGVSVVLRLCERCDRLTPLTPFV